MPAGTAAVPESNFAARDLYQGYVAERSTRHVAGWLRNPANDAERAEFEIVLPGPDGERVLHRGLADAFSAGLATLGLGDGGNAFYAVLPITLTAAERDRLIVRAARNKVALPLAPNLNAAFEPLSYVAMDIVNNCNLRCPFCVYDYRSTRATRVMTAAVFDAALKLIPYVTDGNFWLSCLHEPTLHPSLLAFIGRVPPEYRRKLCYTTNLARRMPQAYFDFLADAGIHHLTISLESLEPGLYERMRAGARHRIFAANWQMLLTSARRGNAPPKLRYNVLAYRSNLRAIPPMVEILLAERQASQVEIRYTFDERHIAQSFRDREFLGTAEWAWLADQLARYPTDRVLLLPPPFRVGDDGGRSAQGPSRQGAERPAAAEQATGLSPAQLEQACEIATASPVAAAFRRVPGSLYARVKWDGALEVYGTEIPAPGLPPGPVNYLVANIAQLGDPIRTLLAL